MKTNGAQVFGWVDSVLNVGVSRVALVTFGIVNSVVVDDGVSSVLIGLFVNGSRSYNRGRPRFFFDVLELMGNRSDTRMTIGFAHLLDRR